MDLQKYWRLRQLKDDLPTLLKPSGKNTMTNVNCMSLNIQLRSINKKNALKNYLNNNNKKGIQNLDET